MAFTGFYAMIFSSSMREIRIKHIQEIIQTPNSQSHSLPHRAKTYVHVCVCLCVYIYIYIRSNLFPTIIYDKKYYADLGPQHFIMQDHG